MIARLLSSSSITGSNVINPEGENIGEIKDLMIDWAEGRVAYAVLSFGGFLGIGEKLFAIPLEAFEFRTNQEGSRQNPHIQDIILDIDRDRLKDAPGFDKDHWPSNPDDTFIGKVYSHYGYESYRNNDKNNSRFQSRGFSSSDSISAEKASKTAGVEMSSELKGNRETDSMHGATGMSRGRTTAGGAGTGDYGTRGTRSDMISDEDSAIGKGGTYNNKQKDTSAFGSLGDKGREPVEPGAAGIAGTRKENDLNAKHDNPNLEKGHLNDDDELGSGRNR